MVKKNTAKGPAVTAPAGMRKREQIKSINRTMFLWVAGSSIVVAVAAVLSIFLVKQLIFNQKIIFEKSKTADTLAKNIENTKTLSSNISQLRANRVISEVPSSAPDSNNLDKVLDALPYEGDWVGLGSSLQSTLLSGANIDSLTVDSIAEASDSGVDVSEINTVGNAEPITFTFKVAGNEKDLKNILTRLDKSIRPIKIISMKLEAAGTNEIDMTVQAATYYQPKKVFELTEKTIKP